MPTWGFFPHFHVDIDNYIHYVGSNQKKKKSWDEVDPEVLRSFEKLGIPEHERKYLAGIEAMNDSETVYANVKKEHDQKALIDPVDQRSLDRKRRNAQPQRIVMNEGIDVRQRRIGRGHA